MTDAAQNSQALRDSVRASSELLQAQEAGASATILAELVAAGLRAFSGSCSEIYREKAFAGLRVEPCTASAELGRTSLMFEVHPTLDPAVLAERAARAAAIIAAYAA